MGTGCDASAGRSQVGNGTASAGIPPSPGRIRRGSISKPTGSSRTGRIAGCSVWRRYGPPSWRVNAFSSSTAKLSHGPGRVVTPRHRVSPPTHPKKAVRAATCLLSRSTLTTSVVLDMLPASPRGADRVRATTRTPDPARPCYPIGPYPPLARTGARAWPRTDAADAVGEELTQERLGGALLPKQGWGGGGGMPRPSLATVGM